MKITKLFILLFSFLLFFVLKTQTVHAEDCTLEARTKAVATIKNTGKLNFEAYKVTRTNYNNIATKYFEDKTCNPSGQLPNTPPTSFSKGEIQEIALMTDNDPSITDMRSEMYSGYNWATQNPKDEKCKKLKEDAEKFQMQLNTQRDAVKGSAKLHRGKEVNNLVCSADAEDPETCTCVYTGDMEEVRNGFEECKPLTEYLSDLAGCPLCPIFSIILTTDQSIAQLGWKALAEPLRGVVLTFFGAYLAMMTLKIIGSPAGANPGAYLRSILGLGFKVAIAYFLLADGSMIYGKFVSPVIKGGIDMGIELLSIGDPGAQQCVNKAATLSNASGGYLSNDVLGSIYNVTDCFSQSAARMPAVGRGLMCYGWQNPTNALNQVMRVVEGAVGVKTDMRLPDFDMWLTGLIVFIFGIAIWMVIGFYLIDCTVQLGFLCVLIPIMIACWPFKITTKYAIKGVETLMNVFFVFAMTGVMLVIGMKIITYSAGGDSGADLGTFEAALNSNDINALKEITDLSGIELLVLIACCIFAFKLIGTINSIADQFSGGIGIDAGAKMGGVAASAATAVGKGAAHIAGKGATTAAKIAASATGLTGLADKAGGAILGGAARAGRAVGLGKYQPQNNQGMPGGGAGGPTGGQKPDKTGGPSGNPTPDTTPD
ncbi:MAG: type IV secretion system protein, partial [Pseudomonadota bacterium]|nr:type IV secretion system protein [Pseudomonadota bacterium]